MMLSLLTLTLAAIAATLYYWLALPRLRRLPWWDGAVAEVRAVLERAGARLRAFCGNSKTIAVAYAAELLGVLDEAKVLDWSQLLGAESAGRVMVIMGAVMILLRLVTRTAVSFKTQQ
jgi:sugar phosphate isomerase/epimerase